VLELAFSPSEVTSAAMVASLSSFNSTEMASVFDESMAFTLKKVEVRRESKM